VLAIRDDDADRAPTLVVQDVAEKGRLAAVLELSIREVGWRDASDRPSHPAGHWAVGLSALSACVTTTRTRRRRWLIEEV
jgi:hypothetical protein